MRLVPGDIQSTDSSFTNTSETPIKPCVTPRKTEQSVSGILSRGKRSLFSATARCILTVQLNGQGHPGRSYSCIGYPQCQTLDFKARRLGHCPLEPRHSVAASQCTRPRTSSLCFGIPVRQDRHLQQDVPGVRPSRLDNDGRSSSPWQGSSIRRRHCPAARYHRALCPVLDSPGIETHSWPGQLWHLPHERHLLAIGSVGQLHQYRQ